MSLSWRTLRITIGGVLLAVLAISFASAQREFAPEPMPPHPVIQRDLTLLDMRVDIKIDGATARTTLRQTLRNDGQGMADGDNAFRRKRCWDLEPPIKTLNRRHVDRVEQAL